MEFDFDLEIEVKYVELLTEYPNLCFNLKNKFLFANSGEQSI